MKTPVDFKKIAENLAAKMISHDAEEWPPSCIFFAYQPVRPESPAASSNSIANVCKEETLSV